MENEDYQDQPYPHPSKQMQTGSTKWPAISPRRSQFLGILGDDYEFIRETILAFQKSRVPNWDEYRTRLDPGTQDLLRRKFFELRESGFYGFHVGGKNELDYLTLENSGRGFEDYGVAGGGYSNPGMIRIKLRYDGQTYRYRQDIADELIRHRRAEIA